VAALARHIGGSASESNGAILLYYNGILNGEYYQQDYISILGIFTYHISNIIFIAVLNNIAL
jgi:hypothetical protein